MASFAIWPQSVFLKATQLPGRPLARTSLRRWAPTRGRPKAQVIVAYGWRCAPACHACSRRSCLRPRSCRDSLTKRLGRSGLKDHEHTSKPLQRWSLLVRGENRGVQTLNTARESPSGTSQVRDDLLCLGSSDPPDCQSGLLSSDSQSDGLGTVGPTQTVRVESLWTHSSLSKAQAGAPRGPPPCAHARQLDRSLSCEG